VLEIRRTQEQYRILKADRQRRREYRSALSQQYLFLSEFLREQGAQLPSRERKYRPSRIPEVGCAARSREAENGDRFRHFSGPGGRYYLLLCDGMGTGMGAAQEGRSAVSLLHQMLTAGFPPEHALESLNSLLALRGRAGAVTVDLAELRLDTGTGVLYKWGAAPSYLLRGDITEKIGTAGPPPGIRGAEAREQQSRLSLRRGETLILLSDGVEGEEIRRLAVTETATPAGELAARLLEAGAEETSDDATLAVVRLHPGGVLT
jgi:stage II sporulation protein E